MTEPTQPDLTTLTVQLLSAYVSNNTVASNDLAELIKSTRQALKGETPAPAVPEPVAAVSVRRSVADRNHILSMIDGKPYKTLKRHISRHGFNEASYRQQFNLPADYPMVAPGYSEERRQVAKRLGLGRKPAGSAPVAPPPENKPTPVQVAKPMTKAKVAKSPQKLTAKVAPQAITKANGPTKSPKGSANTARNRAATSAAKAASTVKPASVATSPSGTSKANPPGTGAGNAKALKPAVPKKAAAKVAPKGPSVTPTATPVTGTKQAKTKAASTPNRPARTKAVKSETPQAS